MSIKIKQRDESDCGAACLASILSYYRRTLSIARIRQLAGTNQRGTTVWGIVEAADKLGFSAKGVTGTEESLAKIPLPAIAHIIKDSPKGPLHHFVVLYSVTDKSVKIMDPESGDISTQSRSHFLSLWKQRVLVLLLPNHDFGKDQDIKQKTTPLQQIFKLIYPHKVVLIACILGSLFYTLLGLSTSFYIEKITDHVFPSGNKNLLNLMGVLMIVLLIFQQLLSILQSLLTLKVGQFIDAQLILGYINHLLKLPMSFLTSMKVGELVSRINDAVKIRLFINEILIKSITNVLITLFSFIVIFTYHWKLGISLLPIVPVYIIGYYIVNRLNKKNERRLMETSAVFEAQIVENISSVGLIKSLNLNSYIENKTEEKVASTLNTIYRSGKVSIGTVAFSECTNRLFVIILLWVGSYYVLDSSITPGELMSFYSLIGYFTLPLSSLLSANKSIQNALIAGDRLFEIMDLDNEELEIAPAKIEGFNQLDFSDVSFHYNINEKATLNGLSFKLSRGEMIAFVGGSGCGKSTVANIILGMYTPEKGKIKLNAVDLNSIPKNEIRSIFSVVPQEPKLLLGSILENITCGDYSPNLEVVYSLIDEVGLSTMINNLPEGVHTMVGELGARLSGGEKQKIAIARALYRDSDVIILDEPTSALDVFSERLINKLLLRLKEEGKTIIIISHRLTSVVDSDRIYVMEKGAIIEEGRHLDLLQLKGSYYQMSINER